MLDSEELLSSLIGYRTIAPSGNELECARFIFDYLKDLKIEDSEIDIQEFDGNRANVVAVFGIKKEPGLVLSGHMDVVPTDDEKLWHSDPFKARLSDGRLYGRGASDMKSGLATVMKALQELSKNEPITRKLLFVATAGEETGFVGLRRLVSESMISRKSAEYVIIGEPTDLRPARAHRGICRFKVTFFGKSSHASTPDLGVNAIEYACNFVRDLEKIRTELSGTEDELLGPTTITPTMIEGGIGENVVPPIASIIIDSRRLPIHSYEFIRSRIESECARLNVKYSIEEIINDPPLNTPEGNYLTRLTEELTGEKSGSCAFGTEGSLYSGQLGIPTIVIGPGSVTQAHVVNEYVELSQLKKATSIYSSIIHRVCS